MLDAGQTEETLLEVNNIEVIYTRVILVLQGVSLSVGQARCDSGHGRAALF